MARICAYCRKQGKLTREHIWPKGILDRVGYKLGLTPQGKVIGGGVTIADVCATCNNGPLSKLDGYICGLYDQFFYRFHDRGAEVQFDYDWCRLTNWFLKASFNAARAAKNSRDIAILTRCTGFIRGIDKRQPDLAVWADLTEPSFAAKQSASGIYEAKKLLPAMIRFATIRIPDVQLQDYILRIVAINAFYFYLAIPVIPYMALNRQELDRICEFFSLMTILDPEATTAMIKTSGLAVHNIVAPHLFQNEDAYRSHIQRQAAQGADRH